jgi:hypothetical protein
MKMNFQFSGLICLLMLLVACTKDKSSNVNQDRIYQDLELFYDSNTDKTTVIARFKFGGATGTFLELDSGATVKFNGEMLPFNNLLFGHSKEYAGRLNAGTFVYTNVNGKIFTNTLAAIDTIAFPASLDTVPKSAAYDLAWAGTALQPDETVGIFIGSWTWGQDALYLQDADGATNIVLGKAQLSTLPVGPSTFYMERTVSKKLIEKTTVGGVINTKYRAKNKVVQVID